MIRKQAELEELLEVLDINKDKIGQFTIQVNPSKFQDGNVDITICILNKKKKIIDYMDIYEDITIEEAKTKTTTLNDWFIEDIEFSAYYNVKIENNY